MTYCSINRWISWGWWNNWWTSRCNWFSGTFLNWKKSNKFWLINITKKEGLFTWILLVIGIVINPDVAMLFLRMIKNVKWTTNSSSTLLLLSSLPHLSSVIHSYAPSYTHAYTAGDSCAFFSKRTGEHVRV
jgi:hypothetical protein